MQLSASRLRPRNLAAACLVLLVVSADAYAGWTTSGNKIIAPSGAEFRITGINWYGFETSDSIAHGLYQRDYTYVIDQIRQYGFNTIRIPFSNAMWELNPVPNANTKSACPTCGNKRARDILALIVNYAGSRGLHVILDNHRSEAGNSAEAKLHRAEVGRRLGGRPALGARHPADFGRDGHRDGQLLRLGRAARHPRV
jgi:aryl-phospho-beta-D-glucosidase BglC (GH1 family)